MALLYSAAAQTAQLQALINNIGTATTGSLVIYSGAQVAKPDTTPGPTGSLVAITLPAPPLTITTGSTAAASVTALAGTWSGVAGTAGTAASWRIFNNTGTVCVMQGVMTDLVLNNNSIAVGQTVSVTSFAITAGNF
jgi:hypothetical protein